MSLPTNAEKIAAQFQYLKTLQAVYQKETILVKAIESNATPEEFDSLKQVMGNDWGRIKNLLQWVPWNNIDGLVQQIDRPIYTRGILLNEVFMESDNPDWDQMRGDTNLIIRQMEADNIPIWERAYSGGKSIHVSFIWKYDTARIPQGLRERLEKSDIDYPKTVRWALFETLMSRAGVDYVKAGMDLKKVRFNTMSDGSQIRMFGTTRKDGMYKTQIEEIPESKPTDPLPLRLPDGEPVKWDIADTEYEPIVLEHLYKACEQADHRNEFVLSDDLISDVPILKFPCMSKIHATNIADTKRYYAVKGIVLLSAKVGCERHQCEANAYRWLNEHTDLSQQDKELRVNNAMSMIGAYPFSCRALKEEIADSLCNFKLCPIKDAYKKAHEEAEKAEKEAKEAEKKASRKGAAELEELFCKLELPAAKMEIPDAVESFIMSNMIGYEKPHIMGFLDDMIAKGINPRFTDKKQAGAIISNVAKKLKDVAKEEEAKANAANADDAPSYKVDTCGDDVFNAMPMFIFRDTLEYYIYRNGVYVLVGTRDTALYVRSKIREMFRQNMTDIKTGEPMEASTEYISAVLRYLEDNHFIERDDIENDINKICLLNGVYDLEADKLLPHSPDYKFIRQIPLEYNPDAKCPNIERFLSEIVHPENVSVLLELLGYSLIPDTRIQKGFLFTGKGANGKSVFLSLLQLFVGNKNCSKESLQAIEKDPYSVAQLYGKLLNVCPDIASAVIYDNTTLKQIIGDELRLRGRNIYCPPFDFKNTARMVFSANKLPPVPNGDFAYFRRWNIIEFPHTFTGDKADKNLIKKLTTKEEMSGLLNLVLKYLKPLLERGEYSYDATVEEVERKYRINSDHIAAFADECLTYSENETPKIAIMAAYCDWCKANDIKPEHNIPFSKRFKKLGYVEGRESGGQRLHTWQNVDFKDAKVCKTRTDDENPSELDGIRPSSKKYSDGENQIQAVNPSECPGSKQHCVGSEKKNISHQEGEEKIFFSEGEQHIGEILGHSDGTAHAMRKNPSKYQKDTRTNPDGFPAEQHFFKDLSQFLNDYERLMHENINSLNIVEVCKEYKDKRKKITQTLDKIIETACKIKAIDTIVHNNESTKAYVSKWMNEAIL